MVRLIWLTLVALHFFGCGGRPDTHERNNNFGWATNAQRYQVDPPGIEANDIKVSAYLKDDLQKGELILYLGIKNNSEGKINMDYTNCDLSIDAERVVVPDIRKTFQTQILPGEGEQYEIHYYPINSVDFYFRSGYRGDMKQQYSLTLDFLTDEEGKQLFDETFTFRLGDSAYQAYTTQLAREKHMQIFDFDFDSEAFAANQLDHLKKILPDVSPEYEHTVLAITPSLTIDQVIMNTLAYKYKDTLMIDVRMLNQGAHSIKVLLNESNVKAGGKTYAVADHFSDSFENGRLPDVDYIFKPGTRLHLLLKYYVPSTLSQWNLSNDWLLVPKPNGKTQAWREWLHTELKFRESSITNTSL